MLAPTQADPCFATLAVTVAKLMPSFSSDSDCAVYVRPNGRDGLADTLIAWEEPIKENVGYTLDVKALANQIELIRKTDKLGHFSF